MNNNEIRGATVDAAMKVHSALGPGLLESAYNAVCLTHELVKRGPRVNCEVPLPVVYDGLKLEAGYRLHAR
jgi:GxxExxY protein